MMLCVCDSDSLSLSLSKCNLNYYCSNRLPVGIPTVASGSGSPLQLATTMTVVFDEERFRARAGSLSSGCHWLYDSDLQFAGDTASDTVTLAYSASGAKKSELNCTQLEPRRLLFLLHSE